MQAYGNDLKSVQEIFLEKRDSPPIASNLPAIAGTAEKTMRRPEEQSAYSPINRSILLQIHAELSLKS